MLKLLGCVFVLSACVMLGCINSKKKADRVKEIKLFIHALNILETEIKYTLSILPEAFRKISEMMNHNVGITFKKAEESISKYNCSAQKAWNTSLEDMEKYLSLSGEDLAIIYSLGDSLGEVDAESQMKNIRMIIEQLNHQEILASEDRAKTEKLIRNLGALFGIALVIILF